MTTPTPIIDITTLHALSDFEAHLPDAPDPVGNYVPVMQEGNLLYTSGAIPLVDGKLAFIGAVGGMGLSVAEAQHAAQLCILNALSAIRHHLGGSLHSIKQIVKVTGFVQSADGFYEQPAVIDGASDLLVAAFGEQGKHARSAVGVSALPKNASVEIELIVALK